MYSAFKYESVPLQNILLDTRNPRIVTQSRLSSQEEVLQYLFEYEGLAKFIGKIFSEGKNVGAERPYVVKTGTQYTVVEGNTRIAAYKVLAGLLKPPKAYASGLPKASQALKKTLLNVDCSIAPTRDALLPIMANAHFGLGDKSKWGYLGSRKAVYDEWKSGKTIPQLAKAFDRTQPQIRELILEYELYLKSITFNWTKNEKDILLNPAVEFNPPVRFLQTSGHKEKVGLSYDSANLKIVFSSKEAEKKFKHLIMRLVISPKRGLGATASYDDVFADYIESKDGGGPSIAKSTSGGHVSKPPSTSSTSVSSPSSGAAASSPSLEPCSHTPFR